MFDDWITKLKKEYTVEEGPSSSGEGRLHHLNFGEGLALDAFEDMARGFCVLKAVIAPCPENEPNAFFLRVMEGNLFGRETRGGAIGLSEDEKVLTLSMEVDYNDSYNSFKERVEDFISVLSSWKDEAEKNII